MPRSHLASVLAVILLVTNLQTLILSTKSSLLAWILKFNNLISRLMVVSRRAKKQAVRDEPVSYLQVAPL